MVNPEIWTADDMMYVRIKDESTCVRHSFTMSLWDEKEASMSGTAAASGRFIGIAHRVKKTAKGEARPTLVVVLKGENEAAYKLEDEQAELDFVLGVFPTEWRKIGDEKDLSKTHTRHIKWKKCSNEEAAVLPASRVKKEGKQFYQANQVPSAYDGLRKSDTVAMVLGGNGDYLAFALSRKAQEIGATVLRTPPFFLKRERGDGDKKDDAQLLAKLVLEKPELFRPVSERDRKVIMVRECLRARTDAMKARIACGQRLRQRFIGKVFCNPEGLYPEGAIEMAFDAEKANDVIMQSNLKEEAKRERELAKAAEVVEIWNKVLESVEGCSPIMAAHLISAVGDIRLFQIPPDCAGAATEEEMRRRRSKALDKGAAKLKAFFGVHVKNGGEHKNVPAEKQFPRKRLGEVANWDKGARQALWLLGEQFCYRPDSYWGRYLRKMKANLRQKHPAAVEEERYGKPVLRWTDAHVHRTATWRTLSRFVEWLHREWLRIAEEKIQKQAA